VLLYLDDRYPTAISRTTPLGRSIAISVLYVCLSARIPEKAPVQTSRNFLYMLPVQVTRSCSDDDGIRYVLPVLWMTICFHVRRRANRRTLCWSSWLGGGTSRRRRRAHGAKSAISITV